MSVSSIYFCCDIFNVASQYVENNNSPAWAKGEEQKKSLEPKVTFQPFYIPIRRSAVEIQNSILHQKIQTSIYR
jgi:hypothetical protein